MANKTHQCHRTLASDGPQRYSSLTSQLPKWPHTGRQKALERADYPKSEKTFVSSKTSMSWSCKWFHSMSFRDCLVNMATFLLSHLLTSSLSLKRSVRTLIELHYAHSNSFVRMQTRFLEECSTCPDVSSNSLYIACFQLFARILSLTVLSESAVIVYCMLPSIVLLCLVSLLEQTSCHAKF